MIRNRPRERRTGCLTARNRGDASSARSEEGGYREYVTDERRSDATQIGDFAAEAKPSGVLLGAVVLILALLGSTASAQYAVGHRRFGGGTMVGGGFTRMDYNFPGVDPNKPFYLLPTIELKFFLADAFSLDLSVPVVNIAASNALQDYFFFTAEAYAMFHPSAPSSVELFVGPGFGISYAKWSKDPLSESGYAFHIPARIGLEFNNAARTFSFIVAGKPFFSLVHGGSSDVRPGGGVLIELGVMAYMVGYRADRY